MAIVYLLLTIGALTTLYPFGMMLMTGFKGPTDQNDNKLIPAFWGDEKELLTKYIDDKYSGDASWIAHAAASNPEGADVKAYEKWLSELPPTEWIAAFRMPGNHVTSRLNVKWQDWLKTKYPTVQEVNEAFNEINGAYQQVTPPPERLDQPGWKPKGDQKWRDWMEFKETLPVEYRVPLTHRRLFQEFLRVKTKNQLGDVPPALVGEAKAFEEILLPASASVDPLVTDFEAAGIPEVLKGKPSLESRFGGELPLAAQNEAFVSANAATIRHEFTWRNYRYVIDYILLNGRAVVNTVVFCLLVILVQLTVNPLAAYALSRFPMKATGKILLFLLATMAFPAEVAMIPSFLLLKDLNLLNTFAALVLPTAASGYMIFLLKGFFDSLPQEVFESGQIDGAPEWKMMLKIAFPLSRPVFGYMALLAFMGAYGAFIYAFLVAQNREMWTLMVFIYQLQLIAPKAVVMAAVTIAALPTLLVFLFAQRVIMRGIVLPGER